MIFTKKQAKEEKKARFGFTYISFEMAEELGLVNRSTGAVAYPREFLHEIVQGRIKIEIDS